MGVSAKSRFGRITSPRKCPHPRLLMNENKKTAVLIGYELTDHYWFAFAKYVNDHLPPLFVRTPGSFLLVSHISPDNHQMNDE